MPSLTKFGKRFFDCYHPLHKLHHTLTQNIYHWGLVYCAALSDYISLDYTPLGFTTGKIPFHSIPLEISVYAIKAYIVKFEP